MEQVKPQEAINSRIKLIIESINAHEAIIRSGKPGIDIQKLHELIQDLRESYVLWSNALRWENTL